MIKRKYTRKTLWEVEHLRKYIINIEEAKNIGYQSTKIITVICDNCMKTKETSVQLLFRKGVRCTNPKCKNTISFPERMTESYLITKNIEYKTQFTPSDFIGYRFDFRIVLDGNVYFLECNGLQHYQECGMMNYEKTSKSDKDKKKYCEENGIDLIWLDCRNSEFEFIKNNINKNKVLPNIEDDEIEQIAYLIQQTSNYHTEEIIYDYNNGVHENDIAIKNNLSTETIIRMLKQNNIELKSNNNKLKPRLKGFDSNKNKKEQAINHVNSMIDDIML